VASREPALISLADFKNLEIVMYYECVNLTNPNLKSGDGEIIL
jgi:hypothetical protein